jgi:tRNA dimethylallyltransferase
VARGWPALHSELARVDASTAARLKPSDAQRIQRAIEVYRLTGMPLSLLQGRRERRSLGETFTLALIPRDRVKLHQRIAGRFDAMLANGLVEELAGLRRRYALHAGLPSMRAVGYRQALAHLDGRLDRKGLRDAGIAATRQLAKRQLTWLRATPADLTLDPHVDDIVASALRVLQRRLAADSVE